MTHETPRTAYILIADGEIDQVCETRADYLRESRDIKAMGCKVERIVCDWNLQDRAIDLIDDGCAVRHVRAAMMGTPVTG